MVSLLLTYIAYMLLGYAIILVITRCLGNQDGEDDGGGADTPDSPSGGGGEGKCDGNLLRNNCGQDQLKNWTVMSNQGDGWKIESTPVGCDSLPVVDTDGNPIRDFGGFTSCFAASSGLCMKEQLVDLISCGFTREFLDKNQPPIEISEWYACRADCGSTYLLNVTLLDEQKKNMCHYQIEEDSEPNGREWRKVYHKFSEYGAGIRYVSFNHAGSGSANISGHYGSKMSGGIVRVLE